MATMVFGAMYLPRQAIEGVASVRRFESEFEDLVWDDTLTSKGGPFAMCWALYCFGGRHAPKALADSLPPPSA